MKQKSTIVRFAAVGSALVFIAGFVWYRGTGRLPFTSAPAPSGDGRAMSPGAGAGDGGAGSVQTHEITPADPMMSGSKSIVLTPPEEPEEPEKPAEPVFMGGSKSRRVFEPDDAVPAQSPEPPTTPEPPAPESPSNP